jgi:hypothetical protein
MTVLPSCTCNVPPFHELCQTLSTNLLNRLSRKRHNSIQEVITGHMMGDFYDMSSIENMNVVNGVTAHIYTLTCICKLLLYFIGTYLAKVRQL